MNNETMAHKPLNTTATQKASTTKRFIYSTIFSHPTVLLWIDSPIHVLHELRVFDDDCNLAYIGHFRTV